MATINEFVKSFETSDNESLYTILRELGNHSFNLGMGKGNLDKVIELASAVQKLTEDYYQPFFYGDTNPKEIAMQKAIMICQMYRAGRSFWIATASKW